MNRTLKIALGSAALTALILAPVLSFDEKGSRDPDDLSLFQFVRVQYHGFMSGGWMGGGFVPPWAHDYPQAEQNFLKILSELTSVETSDRSFRVLRLHDEEIMNHPFLYMSEPGYWDITESETVNLRNYLDKGGFILFDDFRGEDDWSNLIRCMREVYPDRAFRKLTIDDPIFQCFFAIESLDLPAPYAVPGAPAFFGISDEKGRLVAVACYNNDIGDYWEWSDRAFTPIQFSNEAYKFGVNFVIYALTH